jgi:hypothetical protein
MKLKLFLVLKGLLGQTMNPIITETNRQMIKILDNGQEILVLTKVGRTFKQDLDGFVYKVERNKAGQAITNTYVLSDKQAKLGEEFVV